MSWSPGTSLWPHATSLARVSTAASGSQAHSANSHQTASAPAAISLRGIWPSYSSRQSHIWPFAESTIRDAAHSSSFPVTIHCSLTQPNQMAIGWPLHPCMSTAAEISHGYVPRGRAGPCVGQHSSWQAIALAQPELQLIHQILIICSKASVPGGHPAIVCLCKRWLVWITGEEPEMSWWILSTNVCNLTPPKSTLLPLYFYAFSLQTPLSSLVFITSFMFLKFPK